MPWAAAGAMFLLYIYNVPLVFAALWDSRGYGTGVWFFSQRFACRRAEKRMTGKKKHINYLKMTRKTEKFIKNTAIARMGAGLIGRTQIDHLSVRLKLGTGDAALTAETVGVLTALLRAIKAMSRSKGEIIVSPDFTGAKFEGNAALVITVRLGDILKEFRRAVMKD